MTAAQIDSYPDLCSILFDGRAEAATALADAVASGEAGEKLAGLPDAVRNVVLERVGHAAADVLGLGLTDILGAAWRKHSELRRAAAETLSPTGTEKVVAMTAHGVSFAHRPSVEVQAAGVTLVTIDFEARLEMQIKGLLAVVRAGCLTEIRGGVCDLAGAVAVGGFEILRRERTIELPLAMTIKEGIPLLRGPDLPAARTRP
jgi:hypothetical protein